MPTREGVRVGRMEAGAGETVLLLHSSASSSAQWRSLVASLSARWRAVAPDLHGCGATGTWTGREKLRLTQEAALAESVLPRGAGPVHVVGHSYGGAVALRFAVERPHRVASLTLIEPVAFHLLRAAPRGSVERDELGEISALAAAIADAAARGDDRGGMARFIDYWNGAGAWARLDRGQQDTLARGLSKVARDFEATIEEPTPLAALRLLRTPTLVIRGRESPRPTRRIAELVAQAMPHAGLLTIEGAGHMLPLTHRDAVNAAIAEHLSCNALAGRRAAAA